MGFLRERLRRRGGRCERGASECRGGGSKERKGAGPEDGECRVSVGWEQGNGREKEGFKDCARFVVTERDKRQGERQGPARTGRAALPCRDRGRAGEPGVLERGSQEGLQGRSTLCRVGGDSTVRGRNCSRPPPIPFAMSCTRASRQKNAEGWASCSCPVSETKIHVSFVLCLEIPPPKTSLEIGHDRQQVLEQPREHPLASTRRQGSALSRRIARGPLPGPQLACHLDDPDFPPSRALDPRRPRRGERGPWHPCGRAPGSHASAERKDGAGPPCPVVALHPTWSLAETETSSTPRNQPTARSHLCIKASGLPLGASAVGSSRPMRRWRRSDQERLAGCCHLLTSRNCGASDPNAPPLCRPLSP